MAHDGSKRTDSTGGHGGLVAAGLLGVYAAVVVAVGGVALGGVLAVTAAGTLPLAAQVVAWTGFLAGLAVAPVAGRYVLAAAVARDDRSRRRSDGSKNSTGRPGPRERPAD